MRNHPCSIAVSQSFSTCNIKSLQKNEELQTEEQSQLN